MKYKAIKYSLFLISFLLLSFGGNRLFIDSIYAGEPDLSGRRDSLKMDIKPEQKIRILNWIASKYLFTNPDSSQFYARRALHLAKQEKNSNGLILSWHYLSLSRYYQGEYVAAYNHAIQASQLADSLNIARYQAGCYTDIGMIETERGNFRESLKAFTKVLSIHEENGDTSSIAATLLNIGLVWEHLKEYNKAMENYKEALFLSDLVKDTLNQIYALNNIGVAQDAILKNVDSALYYYTLASNLNQRYSRSNYYSQATLSHNLGDIFLAKGLLNAAETHLVAALEMSEKYQLGSVRLSALETISRLEIEKKAPRRAISLAREGYYTAHKQEFASVIPSFLKTLSGAFKSVGNTDSALKYSELYSTVIEENQRKREDEEVKKLTLAVELAQKESEIEFQKRLVKEKANQNQLLYFLLIGALVLVILLAYLGFRLIAAKNIVDKANSQIAEKNKQLSALNHLKDRIFSLISHDVRGPLKNMEGLMELIMEGSLSDEEREKLGMQLREQLEATDSVMDNLLMWSSTMMREGPAKQDFDICYMVKDCQKNIQYLAAKKEIEVDFHYKRCHTVHADPTMASLVLRNLLTNAVKFSPPSSKVQVNLAEEEGKMWVRVLDQGIGVPRENISHIFDLKQNQSTPGTWGEKGTGLGMPLCKELVEMNDGKIRVKSEENKGSEFSFSLPLAKIIL
ncbi:MAG: tetratricopeptide repeat-containing sensor histidine kinase [Bacteroidia bacterium]|nr:tetratricopeptide repeat-containing sensor histidine kinase [Bacteroidia bacterium]